MKTFYVGIKAVFIDENKGVLLLKSKDYWDMPGGRIDGDELPEQTVRREVAEEVPNATVLTVGNVVGAYRLGKNIDGDKDLFLIYYVVRGLIDNEPQISDEHSGYMWVKTVQDIPKEVNPEMLRLLKDIVAS